MLCRAAFSLWHSTNPTLESPSRNNSTSAGVSFRGGSHNVGSGNASNKTVSSTAATVESSLRTARSEDDTWANVARGRFSDSRSTISFRRGCDTGTSTDGVDASDRRMPLVDHDYHHPTATVSPLIDGETYIAFGEIRLRVQVYL